MIGGVPASQPGETLEGTLPTLQRERRNTREVTDHTQCSNGTAHPSMLRICVPSNSKTTVVFPWTALQRGYGGSGEEAVPNGNNYLWYLTNDQLETSWGTLIADPPGQDWSSYSTTEATRHQRPLFYARETSAGLMVEVDLSQNKTLNPSGLVGGCWGFLAWAWSPEKGPHFEGQLYLLPSVNDRASKTQISAITKLKGAIILEKDLKNRLFVPSSYWNFCRCEQLPFNGKTSSKCIQN